MTMTLKGTRDLKLVRDEDGYREYELTSLVVSNDIDAGPLEAMLTPGLPLPGSVWQFKNEIDQFAYCRLDMDVSPTVKNEPGYWWEVKQKFATKGTDKRCKDEQIDDPLLEPDRISGASNKFTEEAVFDRFGLRIVNSAWEQFRGPQNEWDNNRPIVKIEQNRAILENALCSSLVDCVNDRPLWGLAARKIKLNSFTWEKKFYGSCYYYYTRSFEFEINYRGWDRDLLDEGTKCLNGRWGTDGHWERLPVPSTETLNPNSAGVLNPLIPRNPDYLNPSHFIRFPDKNGNTCKVILDGAGLPYEPDEDAPVKWWVLLEQEGWDEVGSNGRRLAFEGTCSEATQRAVAHGAHLAGPFDNLNEAIDATTSIGANFQGPRFFDCSSNVSQPGSRHVEKYIQANFLTLGIPIDF